MFRRYHVTTFGCQMNAHDSERIKGMLESLGLGEAVEPADADVLVFNTCTIREKPDTKLAAYLVEPPSGPNQMPYDFPDVTPDVRQPPSICHSPPLFSVNFAFDSEPVVLVPIVTSAVE